MAEDSRVTKGRAELEQGTKDYEGFVTSIESYAELLAKLKNWIDGAKELLKKKRNSQQSYEDSKAAAIASINAYLNEINRLNQSSDSSGDKQLKVNDLYGKIRTEQENIKSYQGEIDALKETIGDFEKKLKQATETAQEKASLIKSIKAQAQTRAGEVGKHIGPVEGVAQSMENHAKQFSDIGITDKVGSNRAGITGGWRSEGARKVNDLANNLRNLSSKLRKLAESDDGEDEFLPGSKRSRGVER